MPGSASEMATYSRTEDSRATELRKGEGEGGVGIEGRGYARVCRQRITSKECEGESMEKQRG